MNARDAARDYLARGFVPIPIPAGSKAPNVPDWPHLEVTHENVDAYFDADSNIGLQLGARSSGLVDVDIDAPEALKLTEAFLPPTQLIHGRAGNPRSHFWYRTKIEVSTRRFQDTNGECLVELRGAGGQTVVPPSTHPSGEPVEWSETGEPADVPNEDLLSAVSTLAAAALLVRHYPNVGSRQDLAMAVSGALLRSGRTETEVRHFLLCVALHAGDEETEKRTDAVAYTARKISGGDHRVTGLPTVARLLGDKGQEVTRRLAEWLGLRGGAPSPPSSASGVSGGGANRRPDQLQQLFTLVKGVELFHSPESQGFATLALPTGPETLRIQSRGFMNWLCRKTLKEFNFHPREQLLKDFTHQLAGQALYEAPCHDVHLRVAGTEECILIDLADEARNVVEVTGNGWRLLQKCPTRFHRPIGMQPIPVPEKSIDLRIFGQLFNYTSEHDLKLLLAWCAFAWNPRGPYPVLVFGGEAGSAKSTMAKMLRQLVDPNSVPMQSFPRNEHDFMIAGHLNHVLCFDNLSGLTEQQSDVLCRVATGGGFSARQLYSDFDEVRFTLRRPVIVNGIDDLATRPDLIDRVIAITLPAIPPAQRQPEFHLMRNFEVARRYMVGALLSILVDSIRNLRSTVLSHTPRMADFARSSAAAEKSLGWPPGGFMEAFDYNRRAALQTGVESSVVASVVLNFMQVRPEWIGTATELLNLLSSHAMTARTPRGWPRTASQLGDQMRRVAPALRQQGIDVAFPRSGTRDRTRLIYLTRTGDFVTDRSAPGTATNRGGAPVQLRLEAGSPDTADGADASDGSINSLQ
jgi:hypothetical protein